MQFDVKKNLKNFARISDWRLSCVVSGPIDIECPGMGYFCEHLENELLLTRNLFLDILVYLIRLNVRLVFGGCDARETKKKYDSKRCS